jgi:hypothetical protein
MEKQEWNGNRLGMNQEWTRNIQQKLLVLLFLVYSWFIPGPFLGILRNPQEVGGLV